jgi:hypothetical protein
MTYRIVLADDHPILRDCIKQILTADAASSPGAITENSL